MLVSGGVHTFTSQPNLEGELFGGISIQLQILGWTRVVQVITHESYKWEPMCIDKVDW